MPSLLGVARTSRAEELRPVKHPCRTSPEKERQLVKRPWNPTPDPPAAAWFTEADISLDDFRALTSQSVDAASLRFAAEVESNVPLYDCRALGDRLREPWVRAGLMAEWIQVLRTGPGVLVLQGAYTDMRPIDEASAIFREIIEWEKAGESGGGDHFAAAGQNDRIWNSHEKFCARAPGAFARYYGNPWIDAISEAWLGPGYQLTAQVNLIRSGGKRQAPHRDYHMGFQTAEEAIRYPTHCHEYVSPMLTLQGAVAHVDVPVEAGPTKLLPFSQAYRPGYLAWRRTEFCEFFQDNFVQLPLAKGDCLFFNPALFHAGGANTTSGEGTIHRMVNLLQVSSAYGRAMESVDRLKMSKILYPALLELQDSDERLDELCLHATVAACAEGYPFPGNMDLETPDPNALVPLHQQALFRTALNERWPVEKCIQALEAQAARRQPRS